MPLQHRSWAGRGDRAVDCIMYCHSLADPGHHAKEV